MSQLFKGMERIEEARQEMAGESFMAGLFMGNPDFNLLFPPEEPDEERQIGEEYCHKIEDFLKQHVDPDDIERTAKIPEHVLKGLLDLGAFGMKIPKEYGGLGFSYTNYGRVLMLMASWSNILALTVAVPQSIGIAMPILLFGNEDQKKAFLPRVARKEISAFALTEPDTGSDAANIQTHAVLNTLGTHFVVNGEKLWCTNGSLASLITLVARVPAKRIFLDGKTKWVPVPEGKGAEASVHTAFILDMACPGVKIQQRCQFEGCRGIENAHMTFTDVQIPVENLIGEIGKGLKYALTILNVGRAISIPALCLGMAKQAWQPTLDRANSRVTFQQPLSRRQTQMRRVGQMAADLFAMEALSWLVWRMADQHAYDIRIEAAIAKIACSEKAINFLKGAQTIFGGMGYEKADSKRVRGEPAFGIEQLVRDIEMYCIGEGATDILRPFVAREALNPHLEQARNYLDAKGKALERIREGVHVAQWYLPRYLDLWKRKPLPSRPEIGHPKVRKHFTYVERASRRLARAIFYILAIHQEAIRDDQGRQNRIESVGEDLLIMAATALWAERQYSREGDPRVWDLSDEVFHTARERIDRMIPEIIHNDDPVAASVGKRAFLGQYRFLNHGIIQRGLFDYIPKVQAETLEEQGSYEKTNRENAVFTAPTDAGYRLHGR
ncbi:MAG TPA: acyl-CoA dehydrogenase family protein [Nitrospirales bacterium]|nr:acyl-CoA dehydrogenase family protein [Nitrospirales bacterium]